MYRSRPWFQFLIAPIGGLVVALVVSGVVVVAVDSSSHDDAPGKGMLAFCVAVLLPQFLYLLLSNVVIWLLLRSGKLKDTLKPHLLSYLLISLPFLILALMVLPGEGVSVVSAILGAGLLLTIMFLMYLPNVYLGAAFGLGSIYNKKLQPTANAPAE